MMLIVIHRVVDGGFNHWTCVSVFYNVVSEFEIGKTRLVFIQLDYGT